MIPHNRITLITLAVQDLEISKAFYDRLGWVLEESTPDVAFYAMAGQKFGLYNVAKLAEDVGMPITELGAGRTSFSQNFATEAEVDSEYDAALAAGATELKRPEKIFWGGYSGTWADPDGHIWEYAMNPFWQLDADGRLK